MEHRFYREAFEQVRQWLLAKIDEGEHFSITFDAEHSHFIRFNHGRVRQASQVQQINLTLRLIQGDRHASQTLSLTGYPSHDVDQVGAALQQLRSLLAVLPADPYLLLDLTAFTDERTGEGYLPDADALIEQLVTLSDGLDMVGLYAGGPIYRGFASSWGSHGWHVSVSASLDFSLYHANGEAVKITYSTSEWDAEVLAEHIAQGRAQLLHLGKPRKTLVPGQYRVYLAPAAAGSLIGMLRGGFSARALATRRSALQALHLGSTELSPLFTLSERASTGLEPSFNDDGGLRHDVTLIDQGRLAGQLVSARSAREYGNEANGVDGSELPSSLVIEPGELATAEVLQALGTGLYISNLWYLNYSDVGTARVTGMTRFASFWVENGEIVAPIDTLRFDDSLYSILGPSLLALTRERSLRISTRTYQRRDAETVLLPGLLLDHLTFTL